MGKSRSPRTCDPTVRVSSVPEAPVVAFVETVLAPGIAAIRVGCVEYVEQVKRIALPPGMTALRVDGIAFLPK